MRSRLVGLGETTRLFLKLGLLAFGGPSAHIALLEDEVVARRGWMERQHFLDLVGATNLIPGPNSTEMMMHVGYERHGWVGLLAAGGLFILPAALITGAFAWLYVSYGSLPEVAPLLYGIKPAILAVILAAVWRLGRIALKDWRHPVIAVAVVVAVLLGMDEVAVLFLGALLGALWLAAVPRRGASAALLAVPLWVPGAAMTASQVTGAPTAPALGKLALLFLKVGAILYGSGYILVVFLEGDLVQKLGWLTQEQLLEAVAIGQVTPGPVLSTATFVGYLVLGVPGAVVATVAIFLPSFLLVGLANPWIPRLRKNPWTAAFMDAVNVTAVALMATVLVKLGAGVLISWPAWTIAGLSLVAVLGFRLHAGWLIVGGGLLGYGAYLLGSA